MSSIKDENPLEDDPEVSLLCDKLGAMQESLMPPIDTTYSKLIEMTEDLEKKLKSFRSNLKKSENNELSKEIIPFLAENPMSTSKEIGKHLRKNGGTWTKSTINSCLYEHKDVFKCIKEGNSAPKWECTC